MRRLFDTLNKGPEAMLAAHPGIFARNVVVHFPGETLDYEVHVQFDRMMFGGFPDIQWTVEDVFADGDKVALRFTVRGTHKGEFAGIPATGRPASATGLGIYRLADGQIAEQWIEYDQLGMLQQLGIVPALG